MTKNILEKSILIVGVGGQGTLLASRVLGNAAISMGYDVKLSEVHGMSQRGGSVVTYVRYSEGKVASPIISLGEADVILAFEELESARSIEYLKKDGLLFVNKQRILPMPVITGVEKYPEGIEEAIAEQSIRYKAFDAFALAEKAGSGKAVNIVLIGALAASSVLEELSKEVWQKALEQTVPAKLLEVNKKAFDLGFEAYSTAD